MESLQGAPAPSELSVHHPFLLGERCPRGWQNPLGYRTEPEAQRGGRRVLPMQEQQHVMGSGTHPSSSSCALRPKFVYKPFYKKKITKLI